MTGLDCPMQTKALNLFWHKAELRLVEQPVPEAPVFSISQPTLFGGREEFILQYPARLEPPTERDLARHRFTVRHGKKRQSFQAPDAATFDAWLSALEQALEPKRESEHFPAPSTTTSTATTAASSQGTAGTNSQDSVSTARSTGTRTSSRGRTSTLGSTASSQRSHASTARAPALRLTLERPCFTRDSNNFKLIRLRRPAPVISATVKAEAELEPDVAVTGEVEHGVDATEAVTNNEKFLDEDDVGSVDDASADNIDELLDMADDDTDFSENETQDFRLETEPAAELNEDVSGGDNVSSYVAAEAVLPLTFTAADSMDGMTSEFTSEDQGVVYVATVPDELVAEATDDNDINHAGISISTEDEAEDVESEVKSAIEALVVAVIKAGEDDTKADALAVAASPAPRSSKKESVAKTSTRAASLVTKHKWVPLDPANSRLIWVRYSAETDVKSAPRSNPRRRAIKPARGWVPVDPSSTRLIWIRRVENAAARIESRYKATSNTRKWVPLDPDNSRFIWVRRQVVPVGGVATPMTNSLSSRLYRHDKQRRH